jgi:hypothetical protein
MQSAALLLWLFPVQVSPVGELLLARDELRHAASELTGHLGEGGEAPFRALCAGQPERRVLQHGEHPGDGSRVSVDLLPGHPGRFYELVCIVLARTSAALAVPAAGSELAGRCGAASALRPVLTIDHRASHAAVRRRAACYTSTGPRVPDPCVWLSRGMPRAAAARPSSYPLTLSCQRGATAQIPADWRCCSGSSRADGTRLSIARRSSSCSSVSRTDSPDVVSLTI